MVDQEWQAKQNEVIRKASELLKEKLNDDVVSIIQQQLAEGLHIS